MTSCAAQIADASNPFGASGGTLEYLKLALSAEQYHLSVLQSAGAELLATEFYLPEACFIDRTVAAATLTAKGRGHTRPRSHKDHT